MKIGIISDTHDDMAQIRKAVDFLNIEGAGHVLHAGDHVSPFTFEVLEELMCPYAGIFGNNDGDRLLLREKSGDKVHVPPLIMTLEGRKIIVVHEPAPVEALAASGHFDLVVYGHTHTPDVRPVNGVLIINPGKVARLHKGKSTLVLLDLKTMEPDIIGIE